MTEAEMIEGCARAICAAVPGLGIMPAEHAVADLWRGMAKAALAYLAPVVAGRCAEICENERRGFLDIKDADRASPELRLAAFNCSNVAWALARKIRSAFPQEKTSALSAAEKAVGGK